MSGVKPMLAKDSGMKPPRVEVDPEMWTMDPKMNGIRCLWERTESGLLMYTGRNGRSRDGSVKRAAISESLKFLPVGSIIDSEMVAVGEASARVESNVAHGRPTKAFVFDLLQLGQKNVCARPWQERRSLLEKVAKKFDPELVELLITTDPSQEVYEGWLELGVEGAIVKHRMSKYRQGGRSKDWTKLKPEMDEMVLAVVIGWQYGRGKRNGHKASSLDVRLLDTNVETSVACSLSVEEAEQTIGKHLDVKGYARTVHGSVQHPRKGPWRPEMD